MSRRNVILLIFLIVMMGGLTISQSHLNQVRDNIFVRFDPPKSYFPFEITQVLAGEFEAVWADYLLLEIGSFIGSNQIGTPAEYENVYSVLKQILALDPYFMQAYLYAQGLLPWDAKMPQEAIELLNISREHRTWDWQPGHYMGFDYYFFLQNYDKASEIFLDTAKIEGAPVLLAVLGARFALKSQRTQAAIVMLQEMLKNEALGRFERLKIEQRLSVLQSIQQLESAIERYKNQNNSYPSSLDTLVEQGLIPAIPNNPYADHFFYDSQTGHVTFDKVN